MSLTATLLVVLFLLVVLLAIHHYASTGRKYWLNKNVPYREPCPIFGNFGPTFTMRKSYTNMLQYFYDEFRNEKVVGLFQARRPTLMINNLDLAKNILSKDFSSFSDRIAVATDTDREPLLRNLANMSGAEWKAMRHIVTPSFSSAKMKAMFPLIAECAYELGNTVMQEVNKDIDVPNMMSRYTTDVIGSCAFGVNPGSMKNSDSPFLRTSRRMFKSDRSTQLKRYCRTFFPRLFKFLNLRSYSTEIEQFFSSIIKQVLTKRRVDTNVPRHDFLQLMLNVQKTETHFSMTDELITSNSFIFMLAGLETSATTMSFCLYHLAKDKDLQVNLRNEIIECMERHGGLTYDGVCAMRFLTQTVLETLRMHPATPFTTRLCTAPCTLSDTELKIKLKDPVLIPIHCIQNDDSHFPYADKFDPDRFKDDLNPPGFLAFGYGPRSCPGARFAQLMMLAGLSMLLVKFEVEPCERTTPQIIYDPRSVMLKNKGGVWLTFKPI